MKTIILKGGLEALVDDEDYGRLSPHRWYAMLRKNGRAYAFRAVSKAERQVDPSLPKSQFLHREILRAPIGSKVDHRNGNGLDNRRANLRLCTQSENLQNQRPQTSNTNPRKTSRFKGVSVRKRGGPRPYVAAVTLNKKKIRLGSFSDEMEAAKAYDRKAKELFGEFALTNFP